MIILNSSDENFRLVRILTRKSNCQANLRTRQQRISQELEQLTCYTGLVYTHFCPSSSLSERFPRETEATFQQENGAVLNWMRFLVVSHCFAICCFRLQHHTVGKFKENYFLQSLDTTWSAKHIFTYRWNRMLLSSVCEQTFPRGMPHPHAVGCQPENSSKNRFKKLCACELSLPCIHFIPRSPVVLLIDTVTLGWLGLL